MIVDHLERSDASFRAHRYALRGGMARVSDKATALAHRSRPSMLNVNAAYERPGPGSLPRSRRICSKRRPHYGDQLPVHLHFRAGEGTTGRTAQDLTPKLSGAAAASATRPCGGAAIQQEAEWRKWRTRENGW